MVQRWRPDFDPENETISRMALWIRINGLPVKYFEESIIAQIGSLVGTVVKVDQLTLAQARGMFARVCVEVNLEKPLKPFVEVESGTFGIVYEGISMVCFGCGCYGHVKDKCSNLANVNGNNEAAENPMQEDNRETQNNYANDNSAKIDTTQTDEHGAKSEGMGPWMLMSYKHRKKNVDNLSSRKNNTSSGSRFRVLNNAEDEEPLGPQQADVSPDMQTHTPDIVKLWQSFQDKSGSARDHSDALGKNKDNGKKKVADKETIQKNSTTNRRQPLKEVSNKVRSPNAAGTSTSVKVLKNHRKSKAAIDTNFNLQLPDIQLNFSNSVLGVCSDTPATFGRCPPEENISNIVPCIHEGGKPPILSNDVAMLQNEDTNASGDEQSNFPSSTEEDMIMTS